MLIKVSEGFKLERIDKYLLNYLSITRSQIAKLFDLKQVKVNEECVKPSYLVNIDDLIDVNEEIKVIDNLQKEDLDIKVVYEDKYLLVINKESGVVVHPGNGNPNHTLVNGLLNYTNLSDVNGEFRPGIVHRIDKDTSGLLIVAKDNKTHELLSNMIKNKEIKREYIALVEGEFKHQTATIDAPIGRDKNNRQKMTVTDTNSKNAVTHLTVIKKYKNYTLLKLRLETGRTHQIRVHLKYIGFPVFNDPLYNKKESTSFGQFLHSANLEFIHPITNEKISVSADIPEYFENFINNLEEL